MTRYNILIAALKKLSSKKLSKTEDDKKVLSEWEATGDTMVVVDNIYITYLKIRNTCNGNVMGITLDSIQYFSEYFQHKYMELTLKKYDIDLNKKYFVQWKESIFQVSIHGCLTQGRIKIKYRLFDKLDEIMDIETFKQSIRDVTQYMTYSAQLNSVKEEYGITDDENIDGIYRISSEKHVWIVMYNGKKYSLHNYLRIYFNSQKNKYVNKLCRVIERIKKRDYRRSDKPGKQYLKYEFNEKQLFDSIDNFLSKAHHMEISISNILRETTREKKAYDILQNSNTFKQSEKQMTSIRYSCKTIKKALDDMIIHVVEYTPMKYRISFSIIGSRKRKR